jgi:coenzyme F420-reducing hydrogenase delta subunit
LEPRILVFSCNWDGWSCLEAATDSGLQYPPSVRIIRVSCLSRIHAGLILKAFELRADGVMLLGCKPGNCHYNADSDYISREYEKTRHILEMLGINKERLTLVQLPAFDGQQFVTQIKKFYAEIQKIPAAKRARMAGAKTGQVTGVK